MLPEQERLYIFLQSVGAMLEEQAKELDYDYPEKAVKHAILDLFKNNYIFYSKKRDYILMSPRVVPQRKVTDAIWLFLTQVRSVDICNTYEPSAPAQLGYLKGMRAYEIIVADDMVDFVKSADMLKKRIKMEKTAGTADTTTYFFIVYHESMVEKIGEYMAGVPITHAVAVAQYVSGKKVLQRPEFTFYRPVKDD